MLALREVHEEEYLETMYGGLKVKVREIRMKIYLRFRVGYLDLPERRGKGH